MANYAVMNGDIVENIIVADSLEIAETVTEKTCVEYNTNNPAGIGWTYDGKKFVAPTTESNTDPVE
jgi:hypothetical protein